MSRDRINQWAALDYFNPTEVLRSALRQGYGHRVGGRTDLPSSVVHPLERKELVESLDAAIFAHGLRIMFPARDVAIARFEDQDYDFIVRFGPAKTPNYMPLQLKVLVPEIVNPSQTLQGAVEGLKKYADSRNLVVAIKIDRLNIDPTRARVPALKIGELWFFGISDDIDTGWYLYGDCLGMPQRFKFCLPDSSTSLP